MYCFFPCFRPGCRHNAVQPLKKIGKRNTIMWVQCMTDVFSYTGAERVAIPVWAVFIRTAVSVIRTPAVRWSSRSSMTMPIVFPMGLPWSAKGKRTIVVSGLSIVRGVKSCPVSMRMSRVFRQALPGYRRGRIPSAAMGMSIRWDRS